MLNLSANLDMGLFLIINRQWSGWDTKSPKHESFESMCEAVQVVAEFGIDTNYCFI